MQAVSRASSAGRIGRYVCGSYWNRGATSCSIGRMLEMAVADQAVKQVLASEVLRPQVVERALDIVLDNMERPTSALHLTRVTLSLRQLGAEPHTKEVGHAAVYNHHRV